MTKEKKEYEKICVSIDSEIMEKVRKFCKVNRRKITSLIEDSLELYFKKQK
ncbi:MAG: hypothetical protein J6T10_20575 [Methanobrevibacter sp.]|nr:hypothetical protein [Methanobrevibacter sp.]